MSMTPKRKFSILFYFYLIRWLTNGLEHCYNLCNLPTTIKYSSVYGQSFDLIGMQAFSSSANNCLMINVTCPIGTYVTTSFFYMTSTVNVFNVDKATFYCGYYVQSFTYNYHLPIRSENDWFLSHFSCLVPYIDRFKESVNSSISYDCLDIYTDYQTNIGLTDPNLSQILLVSCPIGSVWMNRSMKCEPIQNTGCPRTPLECAIDCRQPIVGEIPATKSKAISKIQLYDYVDWNGCRSVYARCPHESNMLVYDSKLNLSKIYYQSNITIYCGTEMKYYALYYNRRKTLCSNTFDHIDCIEQNITIGRIYENEEYCICDIAKKSDISQNVSIAKRTKSIYLILTLISVVLSVLIAAQITLKLFTRIMRRILPKSAEQIYIEELELWKIASRIHIHFDQIVGTGTWSKVYLGTSGCSTRKKSQVGSIISHKTKVAVKIPNSKNDTKWLNQLRIQASLDYHPNIIRLIGFRHSLTDQSASILTEVAKGNLLDFVKNREFLHENIPISHIFHRLINDIILGMIYIIENDIIHRNLMAVNILLDKNNVTKISGFGLATFSIRNSCINYSDKNDHLLPIKWMPIEAIQEHRFSEKSDVWSFGVVLYELLSFGAQPYAQIANANELIDYLCSGRRLPKPEMITDDDDKIYRKMMNCWAQMPYYRPTFHELRRYFARNSSIIS